MESLVRTLVENVHDLALVYDAQRLILFANRTAERILGYGPGELVGQTIEQTNSLARVNKEPRAEYSMMVFGEKKPWTGTWRKVNRDGMEIAGQLTATPVIQSSNVAAVVEAMRLRKSQPDLERELALEALLNEKTMELMSELTLIVGPLGELAFVNRAFAQLIGEPSSRIVGRAAAPYFEEGFLNTLRAELAAGQQVRHRPATMRISPRSRPREVVVAAASLNLEDQAEPYMLVVIEDLMELSLARTHGRRMAQALDVSREVVLWTDPEGRLVDATPQARRVLGLDAGSTRSRRLADLVEGLPPMDQVLAHARARRVVRLNVSLPGGRPMKIRGRLVPTRDGRSEELVIVLRAAAASARPADGVPQGQGADTSASGTS